MCCLYFFDIQSLIFCFISDFDFVELFEIQPEWIYFSYSYGVAPSCVITGFQSEFSFIIFTTVYCSLITDNDTLVYQLLCKGCFIFFLQKNLFLYFSVLTILPLNFTNIKNGIYFLRNRCCIFTTRLLRVKNITFIFFYEF